MENTAPSKGVGLIQVELAIQSLLQKLPKQSTRRVVLASTKSRSNLSRHYSDCRRWRGNRQEECASEQARRRSPCTTKGCRRLPPQVFAGTGTGASDRDASVQGTAYLTFTLVPNST
ncbi:hypothetical protein FA15DRAFT_747670 [Coprinopsis marcescibilis]|uniref:Uncharacterized protein n=1 Tax=Coprinopsis marcescibilis TaxID=230819 RepID=A0A5C3KQN3_COPMA|nr:hypothetical protein FA15DRAFT_747670 [Coprinopsis marcescibilis]